MNINKTIINCFLAVTAVVGMGSCSSDDYTATEMPNNAQVFFSNGSASEYLLQENQNSVQIEVKRVKTDGELTVNIEAVDTTSAKLFNIGNSVTFADGSDTAVIPVTFNFASLAPDNGYALNFKLTGETTAYGEAEKSVIIKYAPWSEWGPLGWEYPSNVKSFAEWEIAYANASNNSDIAKDGVLPTYTYAQYLSGTYSQPVFIRQSMLNPDNAQLMLYDWFYGVNLIIDWNRAINDFTIAKQLTGYYHSNYGEDVYVADSYVYWHDIRNDPNATDKSKLACRYDKDNGQFILNVAYFISLGVFGYGSETIQLPGYEKADYSLNISDEGAFQSGAQLGEVFNFTLGADLGKIKFANFAGQLSDDEIGEKAEGVFSGEIESTATTENGYKVVMVPEEGDYTLVAVLYDADGNRVGTTSLAFTVTAPQPGKTWSAVYVGDYEYSLFFTDEDEKPVTDAGLTLYQCNEDPTLFKIEHWGYDVDFTFTMDDKGNVMVSDQPTGYEHPKYGMVMIDDLVDYTGNTKNGQSYYENGVFNFAVVYYVTEGEFAYGTETFTLTGKATQAVNKALAAAKVKKNANSIKMSKSVLNVSKNIQIHKDIKPAKSRIASPKSCMPSVLASKKPAKNMR